MIESVPVTENQSIRVVTKKVLKSPLQYSSITPNQPPKRRCLVFSGASWISPLTILKIHVGCSKLLGW